MPAPFKPSLPTAAVTKPCVCCRERNHDAIPDHDLNGYVCKQCHATLRVASAAMSKEGIVGCIPHPSEK